MCIANDREQAVKEKGNHGRTGSDTEEWDHENEQRQRGDGVDDPDGTQDDRAEPRGSKRRDP